MRRIAPASLIFLIACGPFFYQAPPTLGNYPERIATKTWKQIFEESSPLNPGLPQEDEMAALCRRLPEELEKLEPGLRRRRIDEVIAMNRAGAYSVKRANFLHELKELAAVPATFDAAADYLAWRLADTAAVPLAPPDKPWDMDQREYDGLLAQDAANQAARLSGLEEGLKASSPGMLPYWLVQQAVVFDEARQHLKAAELFDAIAANYPDHPRAEVAALRAALCHLQSARMARALTTREPGWNNRPGTDTTEATLRFTEFISRYPEGRFTADAHGWLGAAAFLNGNHGDAVKHQLDRLNCQPTREILRSVLRECDHIFDKVFEEFEDNTEGIWLDEQRTVRPDIIASNPLIARLFLQHALDPAAAALLSRRWQDNTSADRWTIQFLKQRTFRALPLVSLALPKIGAAMLRTSAPQDETTLVLLAWSATESGEHDQALALLDRIPGASPPDEALHARAIILQRMGRHGEAVAAFDALEKSFPASPLSLDLPQRRAISLSHSGQAGRAILALMPRTLDPQDTPPVPLNPEHYQEQWCDTLLQFSGLPELVSAHAAAREDAEGREFLSRAIRFRALAQLDFATAGDHLATGPAPEPDEWYPDRYSEAAAMHLDEKGWQEKVAPLQALHERLARAATDERKAALHLEIGRHWMNHRGFLTLPGLHLLHYANSETEKQELLRRQNALELGLPKERVNEELDARDEATHALRHFLEAAKSGDATIAAPALELANEALFTRSGFSLYQRSRALETDASSFSRKLHQELRARFPGSREALRSVYYSFGPAVGPWMPGDYNQVNSVRAILEALGGKDAETGDPGGEAKPLPWSGLDAPADHSLADIRKDLESKQAELRKASGRFNAAEDYVDALNRLDDLLAATSLQGITPLDFSNYAAGHSSALPPAFSSLLDFRERLAPRMDDDGFRRPERDTFDSWNEFLMNHPDSPKAEAASLRCIRALARTFRPQIAVRAFQFPEAPITNGYKRVEARGDGQPNDPARLLALIAGHEARFPANRYAADLKLWKSGALIDLGRFSEATALVTSLLDDPGQPDLREAAALNFCDIAQRLLDPAQRTTVAAALHENPGSLDKLRLLVEGDTYLSRLEPLMPWLLEN